jgi:hypothetical protein
MKGKKMNSDKPVWVQYVVTWEHINSIPRHIQRDCMQLGGCLSPLVYQSWDSSNDPSITSPGYRPPAFRGNGFEMEGRRGDWVVTESHEFEPSTPNSPYRAIVVCTVEYRPVSEPQWFKVNSVEPVLEPA